MARWRSPLDNIASILDRVILLQGDLRDLNSLVKVMRTAKPDRIFHLAAQSYVTVSFVNAGTKMHRLGGVKMHQAG
jgi:GDPmannose 4,6-dehydratase/GDP-4-dehydro-6-deoxy-D-mannose reductase